ncbi:Cystathionine beta-synthase [Habropoda laboriosa]|uniref:Cystathionine beta-synthase n=1 Tax=Habropoda laboriosa TaxID=597456 RepID=A0A0L7QR91_9HYME|nr:PREDICTED: cystathionine beta-synthase [Habropoda laboriosa]KOC61145.1 Cystathionine beta-synthase [Habropoda laboriosa]
MEFKRPDNPSRCTWEINATNSPHTCRMENADLNNIMPDILTAIGQTPLIKMNNIPKSYGIKCEMYVKCEFLNPGGSVKDRIAYRMIQDAEESGLLKPGYTIIEPTSGNTGIGLAMAAAVRGYRCIIVIPEKMSDEKISTLRALGAEIVRTPTEASWDSPEAHINVAQKLQKEIPNSIILDQYTNPGNPLAHYDKTATEIWRQCEGKIDYLIAGAGTGGTISGIGRKLKELSPDVQIVAVDPKGSILDPSTESQDEIGFYEVEGIGYDFIPTVLDRSVIDKWIKTEDCESLNAAKMLISQEGLLCGGSSGAALVAALKIAKDLPEGKRIVIILPDGIRNYMTKFVSDHWMEIREFLEPRCQIETNKWWWNLQVSKLSFEKVSLLKENTVTYQEAIHLLKNTDCYVLVIGDNDLHVKGVITLNKIMSNIISGAVSYTDFVEHAMAKQYIKVKLSTTLGQLARILEKESYAIILDEKRNNAFVGIVNQFHILNFITENNGAKTTNNSLTS